MLITYASGYTSEILVCTRRAERRLIKAWFAPGTGRILEDYERLEHPSAILEIRPELDLRSG